jgi:hypothetical protein
VADNTAVQGYSSGNDSIISFHCCSRISLLSHPLCLHCIRWSYTSKSSPSRILPYRKTPVDSCSHVHSGILQLLFHTWHSLPQ